MSKPRYGWWSYAKYMVREYPALRGEYLERKTQRITSTISAVAGSTAASRTTENTALRQLPPAKQAEYDAVTKAIERTKQSRTSRERMAIIEMVFWKKSHSLQGAALAVNVSYETAVEYHGDFLRLVGLYRGLMDLEEPA